MQANAWPDEIDDRVRVRIDGGAGDILIPQVVGGEGKESIETRALSSRNGTASAGLLSAASATTGPGL